MRKISIHFICIMVVAAIAASMAVAYNSWLPDFNNEYSTAGTPLDSCVTCHVSESNFGVNPYGKDFKIRLKKGPSYKIQCS